MVRRLARRYVSLTSWKRARLPASRTKAWITRMPATDSCRAAVRSPTVFRTARYARAARTRKIAVPTRSRGMTVSVTAASRRSMPNRMMVAPTKVSTLETSWPTPSVSSCSSASMSLVSREMIQPARCRV